jgi:hypothetical protein
VLVEALSGAFQRRTRPDLATEAVVLRPLGAGPLPSKELWRHGRVSKRAMTTLVKAAVRQGLVEVDGADVRLLTSLPPVEPAACPPLAALVAQLELEHPHFPVPYGTADASFTGGPGVDWKPVPREPGSGADALPMTALLSQALVAFAIEYEREHRGPIQWAVRVRIGEPAGGMQRHGVVGDDGTPTAIGRAIGDAFEPLCTEIEARWRERFGAALVDEVIEAVADDGDWLPFPLIGWTGRSFDVLGNRP